MHFLLGLGLLALLVTFSFGPEAGKALVSLVLIGAVFCSSSC
jgi:hypothetical protein